MHTAVLWAAAGTGFTFLMTTLGAGLVFFFRKQFSAGLQRVFLGFAAGVMIAAAVWSLLIPAIDQAEAAGLLGWVPAAGGFLLGVGFLMRWIRCCRICTSAQSSRRDCPPPGSAPRCWYWL